MAQISERRHVGMARRSPLETDDGKLWEMEEMVAKALTERCYDKNFEMCLERFSDVYAGDNWI